MGEGLYSYWDTIFHTKEVKNLNNMVFCANQVNIRSLKSTLLLLVCRLQVRPMQNILDQQRCRATSKKFASGKE